LRLAFRAEWWKVLEELGVEGDGELAKLAGWARQCLHLDDERLGALLILLAAQRPEARQRHPQLAKAATEKVLDAAECIPYGLDLTWALKTKTCKSLLTFFLTGASNN